MTVMNSSAFAYVISLDLREQIDLIAWFDRLKGDKKKCTLSPFGKFQDGDEIQDGG